MFEMYNKELQWFLLYKKTVVRGGVLGGAMYVTIKC